MVRFSKCAKVKSVKVLDGFQVRVRFHDGCVKIIDLEEVLLPAVGLTKELLEDRDQFQTVHVECGTLCWANGFDICSDVLRQARRPPKNSHFRSAKGAAAQQAAKAAAAMLSGPNRSAAA